MILVTGSGVTFVHADCTTTAYPAGTGFIDQPGAIHMVRNDGTAPAILFATYTNVPVGGGFRIDASAPACAGAAAATATPVPAPAATARPAGTRLPNTAAGDVSTPASDQLLAAMGATLASLGAGAALIVLAGRRRQTR